jgi:hypothetical protein
MNSETSYDHALTLFSLRQKVKPYLELLRRRPHKGTNRYEAAD